MKAIESTTQHPQPLFQDLELSDASSRLLLKLNQKCIDIQFSIKQLEPKLLINKSLLLKTVESIDSEYTYPCDIPLTLALDWRQTVYL
jgi:hypothetical protein